LSVLDRCDHVGASYTDDGGWNYSPFEHAPLPAVPEELQGIEPAEKDWRDVFGTEVGDVIAEAYTLDRLCPPREPSKPRGSKAKSQPSARPSSATYLFDVPEGDYRPRRAERLICRWFVDNPVGSTSCRLSLLGAPNARTFGLYFELHHLEFPESLLFAELPREVANDPSQLFEVLQALFARNGAEDDGHYLLKCPPHAISNG
jgi:hypothetical protein